MTQYHVDAAQVAAASGRAAASAASIRAEATSMLAQLTALESSWQGGAAAAFTERPLVADPRLNPTPGPLAIVDAGGDGYPDILNLTATGAQIFHNKLVVHDLVAHIDRRAV